MNCKEGDLAMIVKAPEQSAIPWLGKTLTCVKWKGAMCGQLNPYKDYWLTDLPNPTGSRSPVHVSDSILIPIRPSDEQDEMLQTTGKPTNRKEKVIA